MAIIHSTTLTPTKLELLTAWLPGQPWYADRGRAPELARAGGFRLDHPQGEVGIEFMVVTDGSDGFWCGMGCVMVPGSPSIAKRCGGWAGGATDRSR